MVYCAPTLPDPAEETRRRQEHAEACAFEADAAHRDGQSSFDYRIRAMLAFHRARENATHEPEWT